MKKVALFRDFQFKKLKILEKKKNQILSYKKMNFSMNKCKYMDDNIKT